MFLVHFFYVDPRQYPIERVQRFDRDQLDMPLLFQYLKPVCVKIVPYFFGKHHPAGCVHNDNRAGPGRWCNFRFFPIVIFSVSYLLTRSYRFLAINH